MFGACQKLEETAKAKRISILISKKNKIERIGFCFELEPWFSQLPSQSQGY
ncbi:hypothetical protein JWG44_03965 [Leptospira sp. 201903071]|uniref:hypothetical protein n=1 Tax=Leptospira ainazelensis TaxID=2810034 RepID=UPI0019643E35|nr:hypothetical protein [Leptospira ainazelensis]MBM9499402.1 hypothetical protein [Leptospira ainazelensis]